MNSSYSTNPENFSQLENLIFTNADGILPLLMSEGHLLLYDACSIRMHSQLSKKELEPLISFFKDQNAAVIITRTILMELASKRNFLDIRQVDFLSILHEAGISVFVLYEEDLFGIMENAFQKISSINEYLSWAVTYMRRVAGPVSRIHELLQQNQQLQKSLMGRKGIEDKTLYRAFFSQIRSLKDSDDNLGEELAGIFLHILSYYPSVRDGKLWFISDDQDGIRKVSNLFSFTNQRFKGAKIYLFSTPRLTSILLEMSYLKTQKEVEGYLHAGREGNITVLGSLLTDTEDRILSLAPEELADLMMDPFGIHIVI